jgi:hypothetical protein
MASPTYQFPAMLNNPNPLLSKDRLTSLNLSHFQMAEALGLNIICIKAPLNGIISLTNLMKIYQSVQNMSINPLYLNTANPLGRFCPSTWLP